jgi:hypothetical protein
MRFPSAIALLVGAVTALPQGNLNDVMQPDEFGEYTITSQKLTAKVREPTYQELFKWRHRLMKSIVHSLWRHFDAPVC